MTFYFVDFENLGDNVFPLIKRFSSNDVHTFLFCRKSSAHKIDLTKIKHINMGELEPVICNGNKKEFVDNIISSRLGFFIAKNEYNENPCKYIVVSGDGDFEQVVNYWKEHGYDVEFIYIPDEQKAKKKSLKEDKK